MFREQKIDLEEKLSELGPIFDFGSVSYVPPFRSDSYWQYKANHMARVIESQIDVEFAITIMEALVRAFYSCEPKNKDYEDLYADLMEIKQNWGGVFAQYKPKWLNCSTKRGTIEEICAMVSYFGGGHIDIIINLLEQKLYSEAD